MGRVMKASVCLGLLLALQPSSPVSAGSADCPACPVKASDTIAITALDVFEDASKMCRELNVSWLQQKSIKIGPKVGAANLYTDEVQGKELSWSIDS